ncbi:GGDEF domain-containing protein [Streptantibioticus rubrisoli]|uniref:GGDEF domain-containing protein n=1 Tax=Streptantibioticus rubrisoli TaxID=1387313 RepID=A0ABT1PH01_9ACTN|nr:GGDEF domain-containing protein [Streptantibioticus rubrisoli]MCQ4044652.1 GGDEF domain-containing protein [Streptantibioticus rubrisoli]
MSVVTTALAAAGAVGWSGQAAWMRHRLHAAHRDPLTRLWTRETFTARARRLLRKEGAVVLLVDMDGFKDLNDTHGHAAGDTVLMTAAQRLSTWCAVLNGVAGRLGGDEFAAIITPQVPGDLPFDLHNIHQALTEPVPYEREELPVGASLGACPREDIPEARFDLALRRADEAMYRAKRSGGGWFIADGPMAATVNGRRAGRPGTHDTRHVEGGA